MSPKQIHLRLSLESEGQGLVTFFKTTIPDIVVNVKEAVNKVNALKPFVRLEKQKAQETRQHFIKLKSTFNGMEYARYEKTLISCPENFSGYYIDYLQMLLNQSRSYTPTVIDSISKYQNFLSSFVTNKEIRTSLQSHNALISSQDKSNKDLLKNIKEFFPSNTGKSKTYFGKVVQRMSELDEVSELVRELDKQERSIEVEKILSMVGKCVDLLDLLKEYAAADEIKDVSKASLEMISDGAWVIAESVECLALLKTKQTQIIFKVEDMFDQLLKEN
jgi:hypothetical protein